MGNCFDCIKDVSGGDRESRQPISRRPLPVRNSPILLALPNQSHVVVDVPCPKNTDHEDIVAPDNSNTSLEVHVIKRASPKHPSTQPKVVRRLFEDAPSEGFLTSRRLFEDTPPEGFLTSTTECNVDARKCASLKHPSTQPKVVRRFIEDIPSEGLTSTDGNIRKCGAVLDINYSNSSQLRVIGLSKVQADSVINHRIQHGHFTNKKDLQNVLGIDTETWCRINPRISLVPNGSRSLIRPHVVPPTSEEVPEVNGNFTVDINYSNYHELCVAGLSKHQAKSLVDYRFRHGHFTSKKNIKLISGISDEVYQKIQQRLTCTEQTTPQCTPPSSSKAKGSGAKRTPLSLIPYPVQKLLNSSSGFLPTFGADNSQSNLLQNHQLTTKSYSEPDNISKPRPIPHKDPSESSDGDQCQYHGYPPVSSYSPRLLGTNSSVVRIASWNVQCLNDKKIANHGVMQTICTVILKHGFDLIAIQELGSKYVLEKVCEELNNPTLPKVQSLGYRERTWCSFSSPEPTGRMYQGMEYNGFLWNKHSGMIFHRAHLIENQINSQERLFVRKPFAGMFSVRSWRFVVISVHLKAEGWGGEYNKQVLDEIGNLPSLVTSIGNEYGDIILLGDFNMHPDSPSFTPMLDRGYTSIFGLNDPTNISCHNPDGNKCYDNMWICGKREGYNGTHGVVRRNLHHSLIPSKKQGVEGFVSDHCPIWAGFKT